jgi:GAF domain-containing protein
MGIAQPAAVIEEILITDELERRLVRQHNAALENEVLHGLLRIMAQEPGRVLHELAAKAVLLCEAGSAGVSLLEVTPEGERIFRWVALAGAFEKYIGGHTPRNWSPCGTCLDQKAPVLLFYPARVFTYFNSAEPPIVEGLVIPMFYAWHEVGTIWIVSHDEARKFDREDVRIMSALANITAVALRVRRGESLPVSTNGEHLT